MRTAFFLLFGLAILASYFTSCNKKDLCPNGNTLNSGIISELFLGKCYSILDTPYFVANSESDYYEVLRSLADTDFIDSTLNPTSAAADLKKLECDSMYFPEIDFNRHMVIGLRSQGAGCSVTSDIEFITTETSKHTFKVSVHECGSCNLREYSMNWVKVRKINNNDLISFILETQDSTRTLGKYTVE